MSSIELLKRDKDNECPPSLHSFVPVIEGVQTVGVVCTICGKSVREDMQHSRFVVSAKGIEANPDYRHRRRDPRF